MYVTRIRKGVNLSPEHFASPSPSFPPSSDTRPSLPPPIPPMQIPRSHHHREKPPTILRSPQYPSTHALPVQPLHRAKPLLKKLWARPACQQCRAEHHHGRPQVCAGHGAFHDPVFGAGFGRLVSILFYLVSFGFGGC